MFCNNAVEVQLEMPHQLAHTKAWEFRFYYLPYSVALIYFINNISHTEFSDCDAIYLPCTLIFTILETHNFNMILQRRLV